MFILSVKGLSSWNWSEPVQQSASLSSVRYYRRHTSSWWTSLEIMSSRSSLRCVWKVRSLSKCAKLDWSHQDWINWSNSGKQHLVLCHVLSNASDHLQAYSVCLWVSVWQPGPEAGSGREDPRSCAVTGPADVRLQGHSEGSWVHPLWSAGHCKYTTSHCTVWKETYCTFALKCTFINLLLP